MSCENGDQNSKSFETAIFKYKQIAFFVFLYFFNSDRRDLSFRLPLQYFEAPLVIPLYREDTREGIERS